jgi:transposase
MSLEASSVCVVDATGKIVKEAKVLSEPEALIAWFKAQPSALVRVGLEAGPLSQWLCAGLKEAGFAVELLETRHVRDAFKSMPVKTDRKDARGIAQLMRLGWFGPVHCKPVSAQEMRALLTARKLVQAKLHDVEMSLRGILRGFGLKVGRTTKVSFPRRIGQLTEHHPALKAIARALLAAHFGMTPKKYQSGQIDVTGRISKIGDSGVRAALYEAAYVILTLPVKGGALKSWAALARKLAVILHSMLADGTPFNDAKAVTA